MQGISGIYSKLTGRSEFAEGGAPVQYLGGEFCSPLSAYPELLKELQGPQRFECRALEPVLSVKNLVVCTKTAQPRQYAWLTAHGLLAWFVRFERVHCLRWGTALLRRDESRTIGCSSWKGVKFRAPTSQMVNSLSPLTLNDTHDLMRLANQNSPAFL